MADGRPTAKKFTHIGDILRQTLQACRPETNDYLARVGACWPELVGETLLEHSRPAAMKGRTLLVHVHSSVWLQEMRFLKTDLIDRINQSAGPPGVKDIKFKVG